MPEIMEKSQTVQARLFSLTTIFVDDDHREPLVIEFHAWSLPDAKDQARKWYRLNADTLDSVAWISVREYLPGRLNEVTGEFASCWGETYDVVAVNRRPPGSDEDDDMDLDVISLSRGVEAFIGASK